MRPIKISNSYRYVTSPNGKVTIEFDAKKAEKKKPVCARGAKPKETFRAVKKG